jgi:hypothetical protein
MTADAVSCVGYLECHSKTGSTFLGLERARSVLRESGIADHDVEVVLPFSVTWVC